MSDGDTIPFDSLLLATGASPAGLPIPGADSGNVQPLWSLAHTETALQSVQGKSHPRVILVGAGFIGLIVLNAMFKRASTSHSSSHAAGRCGSNG